MKDKKIRAFSLGILLFVVSNFSQYANVKAISVSAKAACLIILDSAQVLFAKNEHQKLPMASTTKIMTALLTLEALDACGNKEVEITDDMVRVEGTSMGLMPKDVVDLEALAKGMLLPSGNDAANAAAIAVGGNIDKFILLMNEKARQIGMNETKFVTPSGLDSMDHHSTAYDMALLGAFAMENPRFAQIVCKKRDKVKFVRPNKTVWLRNHNKLLKLYDGCIGIKTGFTKLAGRCLVSCAQRNGVKLVAVTLNAPNDWDDHRVMFNYGFERTVNKDFDDRDFRTSLPVVGGESEAVDVVCTSSFSYSFTKEDAIRVRRVLEIPKFCNAPVERGQIVGKVVYYLDDKKIGENPVVSNYSVEKVKIAENFWNKVKKFMTSIAKYLNFIK